MVRSMSDLEVYVRALGLSYSRVEGSLVLEYTAREGERIGVVVSYEGDTGVVRVAAPLDVEPTREGAPGVARGELH
ncbi:hypothetical protein CF15_00905 [Pyrodictium occultum]|uniref:Uncharacterized protein n=1 Tax=Pyrodictium occultum TaxID=2309 RepID=A0A0V8RTQ0_PYROC|nr:hypothetical protein [Pyrodictium occultum]KSW11447.1 hypothetical protein CF15_00905 [Pyrodictium occultum]